MVEGEPQADIFGMDVARYGPFASNRQYLKDTTAQFYKRRFVLTYPNEQLPAGRPLRRSPCYDAMTDAGAQWGVSWGLEIPLYFARKGFVERPTQRRSNAHDIVGSECRATREGVGLLDTSVFARYEVSGPDARRWLDRLLACRIPARGRARLAPMLSESGRLLGDLTLFNWDDETYWMMGSYYLRAWHMRWFEAQRSGMDLRVRDISDSMTGFSISGPRSRELLARLTHEDLSNVAVGFMHCKPMDVALVGAKVARLSITGELGYEIHVPASEHLTLYQSFLEAGSDLGLAQIGYNAALSLRIEKSFGIWSREFTWAYTPKMSGMERFVAFDKGGFIGRVAALREQESVRTPQRLVTLAIDAIDADASGFEPVWLKERRVGFITSGAYGHCVRQSLAMAYLDQDVLGSGSELEVHVVGEKRPCRVIAPSPYDPSGTRMRS
jgi:dimethylglycine dehydrogenase